MTAEGAYRPNPHALTIAFDYDVEPAVGDRVEIIASRKVQKISSVGSKTEIGEVITVRSALSECVVRVGRYQANRQDRIAGENVAVGPCVFGPDNKVYQYTPATPARHDGTATGVKTVVLGTSDKVKISVGGATAQTITLTAGVGLTMAAIAEEINATLTGASVVVDSDGHPDLVCDDIFKTVEVAAVANDAYTLLGWTAAVYTPSAPSHDPSAARGMVIVGGNAAAAVETLEM